MRRITTVFAVLALATILFAPTSLRAQETSRYFPETQHNVSGRFLEYWDQHGGLEQQGYPLTEPFNEVSETNGQTYTVQYFERTVFEMRPENTAPNDVLLSLLGTFRYKQKHPNGAPDQLVSTANPRLFSETGHTIGGKFRQYWETHGGLAQQGYPISDEFQEVSALDGKTYTVQYFQRAVFEMHPENAGTPYEILLSQLGKFRYQQRNATPSATPPAPTVTPLPPTTMPTAVPTQPSIDTSCDNIPANQGIEIQPRCAPLYTQFTIDSSFFTADGQVGIWATMPNGEVLGAPFHVPVKNGKTQQVLLIVDDQTPIYGIWTITMEGLDTHKRAYGYFKVYPLL